jgi:exopolyphosphatase/guanosine-5'-triphosphate,3'-diphosphate pyrophosphatase
MTKAIIDIGTNTFNLLIAEHCFGDIKKLYSTKRAVALGMGGITQGIITQSAIERALIALHEFEKIISRYDVDQIKLIATSAVREASNANEFINRVKEELGREVQVIDGKEEAQLIYKGVSLCHAVKEPLMIMDIGGGSTEFIQVNTEGIENLTSFKIGVSRLYQTFPCSDPFTAKDVETIERFLNINTSGFFADKTIDILIGSSGTFETFYELIHGKPFPVSNQSVEIDVDPFLEAIELIFSSQKERDQNDFIIPIRKKMAPFAAVKTRWVIRQLQVKKIFISPYSLKEGAML